MRISDWSSDVCSSDLAVPMTHFHAVVWLDHQEARVFQFGEGDLEKTVVHGHKHHLHHRSGCIGDGKAPADIAFFDEIGDALAGAGEVLVLGTGAAKLEFVRHATKFRPALEHRVVGVETVDHPSVGNREIESAWGRDSVCPEVEVWVVAGSIKKKK